MVHWSRGPFFLTQNIDPFPSASEIPLLDGKFWARWGDAFQGLYDIMSKFKNFVLKVFIIAPLFLGIDSLFFGQDLR